MSEGLCLRDLVQRYAGRLGLASCSGEAGLDVALAADAPGTYVTALVGHMNLIRPNRVQVLGAAEVDHLRALDGPGRAATLARLLEARPLCLIVADALALPDFLAEQAARGGICVLRAQANSHVVVQELMHFLARTWARRTSLHGVFIEVMGVGLLLAGRPGVGKSELALELVSRGHRLIADDAPEFALVAPDTVEGSCPAALRDFMEVRGLGIVNVRALFGESAIKPRRTLRLVVELAALDAGEYSPEQRLQGIRSVCDVLGVVIPRVTLPVAPGHNMAVLVECTVRNFILSMKGYDAAQDFAERQERIMRGEPIPPG